MESDSGANKLVDKGVLFDSSMKIPQIAESSP
jgi:hypothetical protein